MTSLKSILRINAISCLVFGILFLAATNSVAIFLGEAPYWFLRLAGAVLILNGLHLLLASRQKIPRPIEIIWFSVGDLSWWLMSLALLATGTWVTEPIGQVAVWFIAVFVAALGVLQLWNLGVTRQGNTAKRHFGAIGNSWFELPFWVKIWLFLLNGVFLGLFIYWPSNFSKVILTHMFPLRRSCLDNSHLMVA